jgi:hypothetical protein
MAKFQKGQSGNPKGRPPGTGSKQRKRLRKEHEKAMLNRMNVVLDEIDRWHKERMEVIFEYATGGPMFPKEINPTKP